MKNPQSLGSATVSTETVNQDHSSTAMVGFFLPVDVAAKLAIPEGDSLDGHVIAPEGMHMTLVFLGDVTGLDRAAIQAVIERFASARAPVDCSISGIGRFATLDNGMNPVYASVDGPDLPEFRQALAEELEAAGIAGPQNHGFTPHITLMYLPPETETPAILPEPIPFTMNALHLAWGEERIEIPLSAQPEAAKAINIDPQEVMVAFGASVKALGVEERGGKWFGKIGGYLVLFGAEDRRDLMGDWFAPDTYFGQGDGDGRDVMVHHGTPIKSGDPAADAQAEQIANRLLPPMKTKKDALGIWAETVLDLSEEYQNYVYGLAEKGAWKWSSGTAPHMIKKEPNGKLTQWPIIEGSLTPTPAEPRMLDHRVVPLKAILDNQVPMPGESGGKGAAGKLSASREPVATDIYLKSLNLGAKTMNLIEAIKKLVPGLSDEQVQAIAAVLGLAGAVEEAAPEAEETMSVDGAVSEDIEEPVRSVDLAKLAEALKTMGFQPKTNGAHSKAVTRPVYNQEAPASNTKAVEAAYVKRFGAEDDGKKAILSEVIGKDYRQRVHEQYLAFAKYLRSGDRDLTREEYRALKTLYFPLDSIVDLAGEMGISAIKTTMVEAQGDLGGYAVPPMTQSEISARLPGLTAVRNAGARVVTLANSNSIEIPLYDGGDSRYRGNLRGQWGDETQAPSEQNAKLKLVQVVAEIYTYKIVMSQSLVEDAANLVSLVQNDITDVLAIDEDDAFLVADGVGKPRGILPGGANSHSLTEVASGHATTITGDGVKSLKRGVASQYRARGIWVATSDTYGTIETIKGADGQYMFPDLSDQEMLLSRRAYESEAMADIAASAYAMIFGDMSGYTIVERLGMSIQRFQDSGTGINKVQYEVRRRIGGRVEQPWKFAVMKIAASL